MLETAVNTAVFAHLANQNATFTIAGQPVVVPAIFDAADQLAGPDGMLIAAEPRLTCQTALIGGVASGTAVSVGGVNWLVAGPPQHDGTGVSVLNLQRALT